MLITLTQLFLQGPLAQRGKPILLCRAAWRIRLCPFHKAGIQGWIQRSGAEVLRVLQAHSLHELCGALLILFKRGQQAFDLGTYLCGLHKNITTSRIQGKRTCNASK